LIPLPLRLLVYGTDTIAVLQKLADKMSADKATGACNENGFVHELQNCSDRVLTVGKASVSSQSAMSIISTVCMY
jgi:hypothetical protein